MRIVYWFILFLILLFPVIGLLFYPYLPEQIGVHWGSSGDLPDEYMHKFVGTFASAAVCMIITGVQLAVFVIISQVLLKAYGIKRYLIIADSFVIAMSLFLLATYTAVLAWNTGADFSLYKFTYVGFVILAAVPIIAAFYAFMRKPEILEPPPPPQTEYNPSAGIYKDRLIEITGDIITFYNYYFPAGAKTVPFSQVKSIEEKPPTLINGKWRLHGTGDFRTWFPADYNRPARDTIYIMKLRGKWVRIGFTAEDSKAVSELLRSKGLLRKEERHG